MMRYGHRPMAAVSLLFLVSACTAGTDATTTTSPPPTVSTSDATTTTVTAPTTTEAAPSTTAVATTTTTIDTNSLADGSGCTPGPGQLPEGEWFGFVEEVTDTAMSFDLACWFGGASAAVAAAEDGEESPPPNDYYIRNGNLLIRELAVEPQTTVVFYPSGDPNEVVTTTFSEWDELSAERGGFFLGVWVTIEDGDVAEITEQWVP